MTLAIVDARGPKYVVIGVGAEVASAAVAQAQAAAAVSDAAADRSEGARDIAQAAVGVDYPNAAAALAGASNGDKFSYWDGDEIIFSTKTGGVLVELASPWFGADKVAVDDGASGSLWVTLAGFVNYLKSSAGSAIVGFLQAGTGAIARTMQAKARDIINVRDWGIVGDGATDSTAALASLRAYAATRSFSGNTVKIVWPQGRYVYSASPNWAIIGLEMQFEGEVWLINTGAGDSFIIDGGATGAGVYGIKITGFPRIYGETASGNGIFCRSIYRSHIEVNVRGAGAAFSGGRFEWCVSNNIWFIMNFNEGGLHATPARGVTVTSRASDGLKSGWNNFWNIETSGLPIGVFVDGALGTKFFGGAVQANVVGGEISGNAEGTVFYGTDFEANSTDDYRDGGKTSQVFGCDFNDGPRFVSGAQGGKIIGGNTKNIYIDSGAKDCLISGCDYNWQLVGGVGAIIDNGTRTRYRDVRNAGTDELYDKPRARESITVGASPFTYTNTSGNDEIILVYGGTVSLLALSRFAGDPMPVTGQYILRPRDSIYIEYSSAPAMVRWT